MKSLAAFHRIVVSLSVSSLLQLTGLSALAQDAEAIPERGSVVVRSLEIDRDAEVSAQLAPSGDRWPLFHGGRAADGTTPARPPESLTMAWDLLIDDGWFEATPVVADGMVLVGATDGFFYAVDIESGQVRWKHETELGFLASAAVVDQRVYAGDSDGVVRCFDLDNGDLLWEFEAGAEINAGCNIFADGVLFGAQNGYLFCVDREDGSLRWRWESDDQIQTFPTISGARIFVAGCDGHLHILEPSRGEHLGKIDIGGPTGATAAARNGKVYVGTEGEIFYAIDVGARSVDWTFTSEDRPRSFRGAAAITDREILVGSFDMQLHALSPTSGEQLWNYTTRGRIQGGPIVAGNSAFVGSGDGLLYRIDIRSGELVDSFDAGGSIIGSPALVDGRIVFGTDDGVLYCLGEGE